MFSQQDLAHLSPEALEDLYLETHLAERETLSESPLESESTSSALNMEVLELEMKETLTKQGGLFLKLSFRNLRLQASCSVGSDPSLLVGTQFCISEKLSYHSILFDTVKIDIMQYRPYLPSTTIGRVRVKLSDLELSSTPTVR